MQSREPTPQDSPCPQDSPLEDTSTLSVSAEEAVTSDSNNSCHDNQRAISRKQTSEKPCDEQQPKKKFRRGNDDIIDKMLMQNLSQMSEANDDEEELYGRQVAATLRRFTNYEFRVF